MPSEHLINALAAEAISADIEPLGFFMDRVESRQIKGSPAERAEKFMVVAKRARHLIEKGVDLPPVRKACSKSPSLFAILEVVLFDRAAARGRLDLPINWSEYGRGTV